MNSDEQKEKSDVYGREIEKSAIKHSMAWHGWGSPTGLGLFLVMLGVFLWLLHLAGILS